MAFRASKKRERRIENTVTEGKPITPSVGIRVWYEKQINAIIREMISDYRRELDRAVSNPAVERFYGQDAAATDIFKRVLFALNKKWKNVINGFAASISEEFVDKADAGAKASTWASLSAAGVKAPVDTYNEAVANVLGGAKAFNHTLITSVGDEVHEKIYSAVMLSLTSPDAEAQGASGIQNALVEAGITAKKRVELISRDQTSKLYSSLSMERFKSNGCGHFKWLHSSAGKVPRPSHVAKDDEIFEINDPRLWTGPKSDQGPPGWAINCRCTAVPVFGYKEDYDDD